MLQFIVLKENHKSVDVWTERILTVCTPPKPYHGAPERAPSPATPLAAHVVYLSRKDHPEVLCHHKVRVTEIRLWPHHGGSLLEGMAAAITPTRELALTVELKGARQKVRHGEEELLRGTDPSERTQFAGGAVPAAAPGAGQKGAAPPGPEAWGDTAGAGSGKAKAPPRDGLFTRTETLKLQFRSPELLRRTVVAVRGEPGEVQLLGSFAEVERALQQVK